MKNSDRQIFPKILCLSSRSSQFLFNIQLDCRTFSVSKECFDGKRSTVEYFQCFTPFYIHHIHVEHFLWCLSLLLSFTMEYLRMSNIFCQTQLVSQLYYGLFYMSNIFSGTQLAFQLNHGFCNVEDFLYKMYNIFSESLPHVEQILWEL